MIDELAIHDSKLYTDIQGLSALKQMNKSNPAAAKKEVSQQFETLLVQMLLSSMRAASKPFESGLFDEGESNATSFYNDLYDKQLALSMSHSGIGLAKQIEDFLSKFDDSSLDSVESETAAVTNAASQMDLPLEKFQTHDAKESAAEVSTNPGFQSPGDFVKDLWTYAKSAAKLIGVDPKVILAQAALETNWGKSIIHHQDGDSTHNLFNIKADSKWQDKLVSLDAIEQESGIFVKQKSKFRSYASYADSFMDYAHLLTKSGRYNDAIQAAGNPERFLTKLQEAQYATDQKYSEKIMDIYSSTKFNDLFNKFDLI